jgi:uncharacterized phage protein (TIGR01671 family)
MREIKFRGKRISDGNWVHGYFVNVEDRPQIIFEDVNGMYVAEDVISDTIGQFTGLCDKNGIEIYEGDIVCVPYIDCIFGDLVGEEIDYNFKFVVYFKEQSFVICNEDRGNVLISDFKRTQIEIIGNIHDNPELITKDARNA